MYHPAQDDDPGGHCCCLVAQSCPTLCDPMNCSTPGFLVLHYLPEFVQTLVHWVNDAIQPSYPLLPPFPPAFNLSSIRVFSNESALQIRWPEYWSFSFCISPSNEYSGLISFSMDWLDLLAHIIVSEISQTQKDKYCMISLLHGIKKVKFMEAENRMVGATAGKWGK